MLRIVTRAPRKRPTSSPSCQFANFPACNRGRRISLWVEATSCSASLSCTSRAAAHRNRTSLPSPSSPAAPWPRHISRPALNSVPLLLGDRTTARQAAQLFDPQGATVPNLTLVLRCGEAKAQQVKTDLEGKYDFGVLQPGTCKIGTPSKMWLPPKVKCDDHGCTLENLRIGMMVMT